jgi:predicted nucleic acid-binding Zn ribbon protein
MFCERCGCQLVAGHRFCSSCGKPIGIAVVPIERQSKVQQHLQFLAILWMLAGALNLMAALGLFIVANVIFGGAFHIEGLANFQPIVRIILSVVGVAVGMKAILAVGAGWGCSSASRGRDHWQLSFHSSS